MAFLGIYRALYDYHPQSAEELEIHDGDLLFILEKPTGADDDGWWKCRKKAISEDDDEPEGLVPNNYVEEAKPTHTGKALYDYTKQTDEELSFKEEDRLEVFDESDPDWTLVGYRGEYGFVPALYIDAVQADAPAATVRSVPAPPPMPPRPDLAEAVSGGGPIPGEADYVPPQAQAASGPAAQLAGILAQKTGTAESAPRTLAAPPTPSRAQQFTPEESEEEEAPPPKPARPPSQALPSSPHFQSPTKPSRQASQSQYTPSGFAEGGGIMPSPVDDTPRSPGGYHLYNIHEMVTHMGKAKKLPMTLGINVLKGTILISPERNRDGKEEEWTAEKLTHYSIEGKHVFLELVRPSKSVDFHAGAKDTAHEIVAHLGELAGASRAEGQMREVLTAAGGGGLAAYAGMKRGQMLYEFMAQGEDEVTVAVGDEVVVLDDSKSEEWWMVRRLKNGREGVVPSSYVEITGTIPRPGGGESYSGLNAGRSTVEQNRLEEERLAKEAAKNGSNAQRIPERGSSLTPDTSASRSRSKRSSRDASGQPKAKPNTTRTRTWTDRSGTFKVEAEFIGLREGKIHLHKLNGVKIAVPVTKMSVEDLEYVERATGASLDDDKPLSDIKRRSTQRQVKAAAGAGASVVGAGKDQDYWFQFFLEAGVNPQICDRYAMAFSRDQMGPEVLPEVNEQLLRTLGLKEGDILRVMKHLDSKYDRKRSVSAGGAGGFGGAADDPDRIEAVEKGGLFSGPGGALRNNTKKGRPAPAVQTNDVVSEDAFRQRVAASSPTEGAQRTVLAGAPAAAKDPVRGGFEDDAWDVKPARTVTPDAPRRPEATERKIEPPQRSVNDDIASLSITSPPLQPQLTVQPAQTPTPVQSPPPSEQQSQGADKAIFDKIAALAPARQRPQPPPSIQQQGSMMPPPPPRASSAPGFQPQQNTFGNVAPLQAQLTGYQQQQATGYQDQQPLQQQQTAFQYGVPAGGFQQPNGYPQQFPQPTGLQAVQQNYPALQPQPTGMSFQPQSQFGQQQQSQHYGGPQYQQQLINGAQTGSPFADPPRQPYQPGVSSGLQNSFTAQQTGFGQQSQPGFSIAQPTGINGYGPPGLQQSQAPQLPPQQTGGVFGPPQTTGLQAPPAPLVPQQTGPAPPVRFGVKTGEKKLVPQPTGRANLAKATPQNPFGF